MSDIDELFRQLEELNPDDPGFIGTALLLLEHIGFTFDDTSGLPEDVQALATYIEFTRVLTLYRMKQYLGDPQSLRMGLIESMWHGGHWVEPWISIVDRYFPGAEPTSEDFDRFTTTLWKKVSRQLQATDHREEVSGRVGATLLENGYEPSTQDLLVILLLVLQTVPGSERGKTMAKRRAGLMECVIHSSDPGHPAWRAVVEDLLLM